MVRWAHPSPQPKQHRDQFSHFGIAHGRTSSGMRGYVFSPKNCLFACSDLDPHLIPTFNIWYLGPTQVQNPNSISIGSAVFAQLTAERPYTLHWAAPSPLKIATSYGDVDPI